MRTGNRRERQKAQAPAEIPGGTVSGSKEPLLPYSCRLSPPASGHGERTTPRTPRRKPFIPGLWKPYRSKTNVEYLLDVLLFGETEEKAALITDYGKDVIQIEQRMAELAAADAARTKNTMNAMQPPQSIEEIKAGLETTEKGGVRQSIRNCLTVFQRDPLLSGAIAYNILTDRKDIIKPIGFHRESTALNDTDMKYLLLYLEETYGLTNEKKIDNAIGIVANENKYHPIRDYLSALVWDGTERIRFCLRHFLGADTDDYTYEALKLFLLGAISRAFQPGCKFEIMLCLVGGQGLESPPSSVCWQSGTSGSPMICGSWTMTMCTASCKVTGLSKCRK